MKPKICTKCNTELPYSKFELVKNGTRYGKQRYRYSAWCVDCENDYTKYKTCTICGEKLPKTEDYFNVKITKQKNKNGDAIYYGFKHACRKCLNKKIAKYKREEYWKDPDKARKELKRKYWKDPDKAKMKTQEWREANLDYLHEKDRKRTAELDDSWIASSIGIPVKECPKELIESKKIVIKLKRELGLTHSTISERNINNKYKKQWKQKEI
jgi:hypothetical protein